ncbi:MAG: P-loop NTPase, partial [Cyanobacteria bacterium P01_C01_bin.72]
LKVERVGTNKLDASKIISINYSERDPELVKLVLESTAQKYLDFSLDNRKQGIDEGVEFIDRQLPELNQKVTTNLNEIQALQEQYQITEADAAGESVFGNLREIQIQQLETTKEISEKQRVVDNLRSKLNIGIDEAIAISTLRENPNYQNLITQLNDLEREIAANSARFNSNSPQIAALTEEKQQILALLNAETRKILLNEEVSGRANRFLVLNNEDSILLSLVRNLVDAANELETLDARQEAIDETAAVYQQRAQQFPEVSRRYKKLQQELDLANRTREKLLVQKDRLQIRASQTQTPWSIVSEPSIPQDRAGNPLPIPVRSPNNLMQGLMAGLFLGVGAAVLWEKLSDVFYSTEEVSAASSSTVLAEIPYNSSFQQKHVRPAWLKFLPPTAASVHRDADFLAAFERLYSNIYLRFRDASINSIAICSATSGDGKSTVATGLAQAIAAQGHQVMLVGANSFSYQLPENTTTVNQIQDNLYIAIVSQAAINSSSERERLMEQFAADYDYVIYDTPAMLDSVTANFLSVNTDGILVVTALNQTKKTDFTKTLEQIKEVNIPLLGIVTNQNRTNSFNAYALNFISFGDRQKTLKTKRHYEHSSIAWGQEREPREEESHMFLNSVGNSLEDPTHPGGKSSTSKPAIKVNSHTNSHNGNGRFERQTDTRHQSPESYDHWKN